MDIFTCTRCRNVADGKGALLSEDGVLSLCEDCRRKSKGLPPLERPKYQCSLCGDKTDGKRWRNLPSGKQYFCERCAKRRAQEWMQANDCTSG